MNFNNDFEDSFDKFLSDNANILFRKQPQVEQKTDVSSNVLDSPRKSVLRLNRNSVKIIDDVILVSSDDDEIIKHHKKISPEKKNKIVKFETNPSSSNALELSICQSTPACSKNINKCLQDLTDVTFSDFSYLKESPLIAKNKTIITNESMIIHQQNSSKDIKEFEQSIKSIISNKSTPISIRCLDIPSKGSRLKSILKSQIIPRSIKKNHRLLGRKTNTKACRNVVEFVASDKPTSIQQKDAICHIIVHMSNQIHELLKPELTKIDEEKRFDLMTFEQNNDEILSCPYLYWEPSIKLKEMLEKSNNITNYNSPIFNQIMFFVIPQILHRNVHAYVKRELNKETFDDDSFIDFLDIIKRCSADLNKCSQITIVIYSLDDYLKTQRNKANRQFRRQMNQIMLTNDEQQKKKSSKNKCQESDDNDNLIELTMENIEMYLIDLGMRFLLEFGGMGSANFTPVIVDNLQEITELIYRYSRSLSEQLFRNDRKGDASSDIYMVKNKIAALELDESKGRNDVEKIWLKQLQQMPSMRASVSKAIIEHFPTPSSLWNRLQNSTNPIGLLAKIGQSTSGKVGVDLAEKIHLFMTSNLPNDVLKTATSART